MMTQKSLLLVVLAAICLIFSISALADDQKYMYINGSPVPIEGEPLFAYLNATDDHYAYSLDSIDTTSSSLATIYRITLTSQQWLTSALVSPSIWTHNVRLIAPNALTRPDLCFLYITGCNQDDTACADSQAAYIASIVEQTGAYGAVLPQIPNQYTTFSEDPSLTPRMEDDLVSWTWRHYINDTSHPDYIVYFPMAKAVKKTLDMIETVSLDLYNQGQLAVPITKFYISGASKRGATTWFATIFENQNCLQAGICRLIGSAPMVYDLGNIRQTLPVMYRTLGAWSYALQNYINQGIVTDIEVAYTDVSQPLLDIIDFTGAVYQEALSLTPKLVINAADDQFFLPLNDHYWLPLVSNVKRLMLPNADHSMDGGATFQSIGLAGHINSVYDQKPLAQFSWNLVWSNYTLQAFMYPEPTRVVVWRAETPQFSPPRADWRAYSSPNADGTCTAPATSLGNGLCSNPVGWVATDLGYIQLDDGSFATQYGETNVPTDGQTWVGFYIMAYWEANGSIDNQVYTTQVMAAPDQYPYADCTLTNDCPTTVV